MPLLFHISRSSGRIVVDCKYTRRQRIYTPLVFRNVFLIAVTSTPRHQSRSQSHKQSEGIGQSAHWHWLTHFSRTSGRLT